MYKRKEGIYVGRVEGGDIWGGGWVGGLMGTQLPVFVPRRLAALLPIKRCIMSRYSFNSRKKERKKNKEKKKKKNFFTESNGKNYLNSPLSPGTALRALRQLSEGNGNHVCFDGTESFFFHYY